jgi:hypothetical protein
MCASICAAFGFAVTQPILDLLGRNPEFFIARAHAALEALVLGLFLGVIGPFVIGGLVWATLAIDRRLGVALHAVLLGTFAAALSMQVLERLSISVSGSWLIIAFAVLLGTAIVLAFRRIPAVRQIMSLLAVSPLLFLGLFLFASPTRDGVLFPAAASGTAVERVADPVPIVIVVFDEFPLSSILDESGVIDAENYPNFGRLAAESTWYANAVTVHHSTTYAVPSLLAGTNPPNEARLAIYGQYPNTIFTLLRNTYRIEAFEPVTRLCPPEACVETGGTTDRADWGRLLRDTYIVGMHLLLPPELRTGLPPIDEGWGNFGNDSAVVSETRAIRDEFNEAADDRAGDLSRFIESLDMPQRPTMWYLHTLLPHAPWEYLPSGARYPHSLPIPGKVGEGWGQNEWLVSQAYQRHLLQVGFVDRFIGQLFDRLNELEMFDQTLLIVTSDHGVIFRPGIENRRQLERASVGELGHIPLFIKLPGGAGENEVNHERVLLVDVLPTIADILDVEVPWSMDGVSLLSSGAIRESSVLQGLSGSVEVAGDETALVEAARRKGDLFPGGSPFALVPEGFRGLLGDVVSDNGGNSGIEVIFDAPERLSGVESDDEVVPALVSGRLVGPEVPSESVTLAIVVDERVAAITRSFNHDESGAAFYAMLPPRLLEEGMRLPEVFQVESDGTGFSLQRLEPSRVG